MNSKIRTVLLLAALFLLAGHFGMADPVFVDPASFTGSRDTGAGGGLFGTPDWDNGNFELSWDITDNSNGTFTYEYAISISAESKELSHWILELTEGADWDGVFGGSTEVKTHSEQDGNPGIPDSVFGVKFDSGPLNVTFTTEQAPVWGDFYAVDGKNEGEDVLAYNSDFSSDPAGATDFGGFVARPDGESTSVPEPGTLVLLGSGLLLSGLLRRRNG